MLGTTEEQGLIPRAAEQLFAEARALEASQGWTFEIKVGVLAAYVPPALLLQCWSCPAPTVGQLLHMTRKRDRYR